MASLNHTLTLQNICDTVFKSNVAVIDSFTTFLKTKVEIENFDSFVDEFKEALHKSTFTFYGEKIDEKTEQKPKKKATSKTKIPKNEEKKEKNPSIYNLFVSDHIKNMDKKTGNMGRGDHMKVISNLWNNSDEGHFFAKRAQEIKKENTTLTNAVVYDMVKKEWNEDQVKENEEEEEEEVDTNIPPPPTEKTMKSKATAPPKKAVAKKKEEPKKKEEEPKKKKATKPVKVTKVEEDEDSPATQANIREQMQDVSDDDESSTSIVEEEAQSQTEINPNDDEDDEEEDSELTPDMFDNEEGVSFDEE